MAKCLNCPHTDQQHWGHANYKAGQPCKLCTCYSFRKFGDPYPAVKRL